jgi:hypothetical protein
MKRYITTIVVILLANVAFSQDFIDALRYSQTNYGGTARSVAMGSAFGALGGDFISASINPAGIGLYRSSEFTLSPTLNINNSSSSYLGTTTTDNKYRFNFDNISYVGTVKTGAETGIIGLSFGFGFNRLKNFNNRVSILGHNAKTSLLNNYTDWANSIGNSSNFDELNEYLAWKTKLIIEDTDPNVIEGKYFNELGEYKGYDIYDSNNNYLGYGYESTGAVPHTQQSQIETSGRIDEYVMALGLNVNHKIYIGASLGLLALEYARTTTFSELDDNLLCTHFKDYTLTSNLYHSGSGVNFKAGLIYRPIKSLRIGLAIHTPNFYAITCGENKQLTANYDIAVGDSSNGYDTRWDWSVKAEDYEFRLETPFKAIASASYLLGNKGLISIDYEWENYSTSKIRDGGDGWNYSSQNTDIQKVFHSTGNLRIGGEFRATENFSLRAGYQLLGNPWQKTYTFSDGTSVNLVNQIDTYSTYSAGFGYRQQNFFIDFAYRLNSINNSFKVHELSKVDAANANMASVNYLNNQATITFGFRF